MTAAKFGVGNVTAIIAHTSEIAEERSVSKVGLRVKHDGYIAENFHSQFKRRM